MSSVPMYSPVGNHTSRADLSAWKQLSIPATANAVLVQAIDQNVRLSLNGPVSGALGFRITAGADPLLIMLGSADVRVQEETATATLQYQFVKVH